MWLTLSTPHGYLINTDCMILLRSLKKGTVDCIFADPPFNLGKVYGANVSDARSEDEYMAWTKAWLTECVRVLKPGGSLFVYNIPRWQIPIGAWLMGRKDLSFRHWISISMKNTPPRGMRLYPAHYGLLYFTKGDPAVFNRDAVRTPLPTCRSCGTPIPDWGGYKSKLHPLGANLSDVWEDLGSESKADLPDVWTDTHPVRHKQYKTRAFGVNELDPKIPERAILLTTNPGDMVLDPFGGGGTTYRMAEKHGRLWIGSEATSCDQIREGLVRNGVAVVTGGTPTPELARLFKKRPSQTIDRLAGDD